MVDVSKFDPNYKEQQKAKKPPPVGSAKCITADTLNSKLDVGKFNKMMSDTVNTATGFLTNYIQEQQTIKDDSANKQQALNLERYRQTALNERRILVEKQQKMIAELNQLVGLYESQLQSASNTDDLYKMLESQNIKLRKVIENEIHTIEISDRKTYYENEQNSSVGWWANLFTSNYKYLIIILILAVLIKKRFHERKLWGVIIALALYPTLANYVIDFTIGVYNWILSDTKWVYLYSKM